MNWQFSICQRWLYVLTSNLSEHLNGERHLKMVMVRHLMKIEISSINLLLTIIVEKNAEHNKRNELIRRDHLQAKVNRLKSKQTYSLILFYYIFYNGFKVHSIDIYFVFAFFRNNRLFKQTIKNNNNNNNRFDLSRNDLL